MNTVQNRIASFPAAVVVDLDGLAAATRYAIVTPGEPGYQPLYVAPRLTREDLEEIVCEQRGCRPATRAEREAALVGSMFGWHVPGADPANYPNAG